jgi:5'-nucleotidase
MKAKRTQILLTNDDGIQSPGLWAAAEALSELGFVTVAAPREQASGSSRSLPVTSDGKIKTTNLQIGSQQWETYAVGGTPAQSVLHGILEIMPAKPDLVVSGINYGENIGFSVSISGTVGAALEAAALGIPALAVSLELPNVDEDYLSYSREHDFSVAAHFTRLFADMVLQTRLPFDVDVLKIDVPYDATPQTPWRMTRVARHQYYIPILERTGSWEEYGRIGAFMELKPNEVDSDTDAYVLRFKRMVSVSPISIDMSSRVSLNKLEKLFRREEFNQKD